MLVYSFPFTIFVWLVQLIGIYSLLKYIYMKNIIAVIWDFDKTLVNGYMQDPIFKEYDINSSTFWKEVNSLPEKYMREQNVKVNPDTIYLNHFS